MAILMKPALVFALAYPFLAHAHAINQLSPRDTTSICTPRKSPPAGSVCGRLGTASYLRKPLFQRDNLRQLLNITTCIEYCADMVYGHDPSGNIACSVVTHDSKTNLCSFYDTEGSVDSVKFQPDNTSTTSFYYLRDCFNCVSDDCKVPSTFNFFNNPNFELSKRYIGPWYGMIKDGALISYELGQYREVIPNPVGQGNALRLLVNGSDNSDFSLYLRQSRRVCASKQALFSVDYKIDQITLRSPNVSTTEPVFYLEHTLGLCTSFVQYTLNDSRLGEWQSLQFSCPIQVPTSTSHGNPVEFILTVGCYRQFQGAFNVTLANLKLTPVLVGLVKTKGPEFVVNGGFESGRFAPWKISTYDYTRSYYYADTEPVKALPCKKGQPVSGITSPGFPVPGGRATSKYKASFCGIAASNDTFFYTYEVQLYLKQTIQKRLIPGIPYLLTLEYRSFDLFAGPFFSYGDMTWGEPDEGFYYYKEYSNATRLFQRIFTDSGSNPVLSLGFPGSAYEDLRAVVDNVSIQQLDV